MTIPNSSTTPDTGAQDVTPDGGSHPSLGLALVGTLSQGSRLSTGRPGASGPSMPRPVGDVLHIGNGVFYPALLCTQDDAVEVGIDDRGAQAFELSDEPVRKFTISAGGTGVQQHRAIRAGVMWIAESCSFFFETESHCGTRTA